MPYFIQKDHPDCSGWATVDADGVVLGCHTTKKDAIDQMVAVALATDEPIGGERELRAVDLSAPVFMRANARRGLRLYAEGKGGDGLVPQTITDARRMVAGEISEQKWRKINAWIARHLVDLEAVEDGEITAGVVAHLLWGSGATRSEALRTQAYAKRIIEQLDSEARSLEENTHAWTHKQWLLYDALEDIAERTGKWMKDAYGDGAHYVEESPFQDEGLICANCAFYEGGQACEIVEGGIKPNAICKFWIIPNVLITDARMQSGEAYGGMTSNMDDDLESDEPDDLDGE